MEFRPKCQRFPDCGQKHFSHEPCGSGSTKEKPARKRTKKQLQKGAATLADEVSSDGHIAVDMGEPDSETTIKRKIPKPVISATQAERNKRYRAKHREAHRKYQRDLMRKRRASK